MSTEWILGGGFAIALALLLIRVVWSRRSHAFGGRGPGAPGTDHGRSKQVGTHTKDDFLNFGAE
jgi:hypothetical protein